MGNAQQHCYEITSRLKRKKNNNLMSNTKNANNDNTNSQLSNHKINIHIKKTRKQSAIDKKIFLSKINIPKNDKISNISTNKLMNSFNIINSPKRVMSPEAAPSLKKKEIFSYDVSPLKKFKKSNTMKNIYIKGDLAGEGRFGKIYPGLCTLNAEIVTLKVYDKISKEKKNLIFKYKNQIYKLEHPNLVKTILLYEEKEQLVAVFDCANLKSVQEIINDFGSFDEKVIQTYSRQLLEGLKYLHEQNIYHKNFKPRNILVDPDGNIKISDCYIDGLILGSARDIYNRLLNEADSENKIDYYTPPFFIQNIFYFGESIPLKKTEDSKDPEEINIDSKKIFEDWQSFDLWYMGCLLIEICSGKKPWYHYNFKDNSDFFEFLRNTHLIPTIPKKMSLEFCELVQILFNPTLTNKKNIYDIIFNLNFFKKNVNDFISQKNNNNKSIMQSSFFNSKIEKKIFEDSSYFADSNIQLGQMLQNNQVKNILNNNNNASFSVTNSMDDISFSNSGISNNINLFGSTISHAKNDYKSLLEGKVNKKKSIKSVQTDMTDIKEVQIE